MTSSGQFPSPDTLQAQLAAIVATSDDAIVSKNLDSIIQSWNASAERIFGYTAEEAIGKSIIIIIPKGREQEEFHILDQIRKGNRVDHFETVRQRKDGSLVDVSVTISPIKNSAGVIVGASKIARDISALKRYQMEREQLLEREQAARLEAERVGRAKDEFLATLSHELRTPLNAILGWSQLLRSRAVSQADLAQGLDTIARNARLQTQLIDDLLDMSRIISGKMRLDVHRVDLASVVEQSVGSIHPAADAKGIRLYRIIDPNAGPIMGDANRLQQVLWNLLTNAVKFTSKGGQIQVYVQRVNSHVEITVSDTGQGIEPQFLSRLFTRFAQADSSTTRHHGGLGLGLAIVKHLVELHGGTVHATSAGIGQGATFVISLPVLTVQRPDALPSPEHPTLEPLGPVPVLADLQGVKVLVVDDDPDARELIKRVLKECHAEVLAASSAAEALEILRRERPNLLISDIGMPEQDGYHLLREVRKLPPAEGGTIPAIALTAFARSEDRRSTLLAGFKMHVPKPVEPAELVAVISSVLGRTPAAPPIQPNSVTRC